MTALMALLNKAKSKYASSGADALKPKDGKNIYRILAPTEEQADWLGADGQFWQDVGVHWIRADANGKPMAVVGDPMVCFGEANPIEAMIEKAIASAYSPEEKELYSGWRSQKRILVNALDRSDKNSGPQPLELTRTTWASILDAASNYASMGINIFDQHAGLDIIITKSGRGLTTKYDVMVAPSVPGAAPTPTSDEDMARCANLAEWVRTKYFKGEEQKAITAIATITGVAAPGAAPAITSATPTAALTSAAAVAPGASVAAAAATTTAAAVEDATIVEAEIIDPASTIDTSSADTMAELDALLGNI